MRGKKKKFTTSLGRGTSLVDFDHDDEQRGAYVHPAAVIITTTITVSAAAAATFAVPNFFFNQGEGREG